MATLEVNISLEAMAGIQCNFNLNIDWVMFSYVGVLLLVIFCRKTIKQRSRAPYMGCHKLTYFFHIFSAHFERDNGRYQVEQEHKGVQGPERDPDV